MAAAEEADQSKSPTTTTISNVRPFNGSILLPLSTVTISSESGLITDISETSASSEPPSNWVNGHGAILLPGLIDAHVHMDTEGQLATLARWGVTTALDMACWPEEKVRQLMGAAGKDGRADMRTAGAPATSPDSLHSAILPIAPESKLTAASQAEKFVQDRVASGQSSYIKVICDVPGPDQATVDAIVAAAHQSKLRVVAHAASSVAYQMAQQAKVDYVTHAPLDTVLTTEECDTMAREHRIAIPTLTMMTATTAGPSLWTILRMLLFAPRMMLAIVRAKRSGATKGPPKYENARESVRNLHKAGGTILAGTDAHESEPAAFHVPHGESLHRELELLVEAGLSNVEALCAATKLPAKHFDLGDRGVIEVGKRADLVLLEFGPDPLGGRIRDTRQIAKVWVGGVNVEGL